MKQDMKLVFLVGFVLVVFLTLFYLDSELGLPDTADTDFLLIMPGLICFAIGALLVGKLGGLFALPAFSLIGVGLAILFESMYDLGIVNDAMISNLTISQFQILVIAIAFLVGAVVSGVSVKRRY